MGGTSVDFHNDKREIFDKGKKHFSTLVISDIGGGTLYKSKDNLVGLAEYLHRLEPYEKPDLMVIIGGLFPEIPKQGSVQSIYKIKVLEKGVDSVDDAAATMKPDMIRILGELPSYAKIIYALGPEDWANKKTLERKVAEEYLFYIDSLKKRIDEVNEEIAGVSAIIKVAKTSYSKLMEQLKGDPKNQELIKEKTNLKIKIQQRLNEYNDLSNMIKPLERLYLNALQRTSAKKVKEILDKEMDKQKEINDALAGLGKEDTEEYLKLSEKAKKVANAISRLTKRHKEALEKEAKTKETAKIKQALLYTHNALPDREAASLIERYVSAYYKELIDYTFGFRRRIIVQSRFESADGTQANSSIESFYSNFEVYEKKFRGGMLNIAVMGTQSRYSTKSNDSIIEKLYMRTENGLEEYDAEAQSINILISGHNMHSSFTLEPMVNRGPITAALACGPFWDKKKASELADRGYRTDVTTATQKGPIGVGAHLLRVEKEGIVHTDLTDKLLGVYSSIRYAKELANMHSVLDNMREAKNAPKNGNSLGSKEELEMSVLKAKLPSEMKQDDLAQNFVDENFIKSLVKYEKTEKGTKSIRLGVISDVHVGNYADLRLLGKVVEKLSEKQIDVLVLAGDNIEGNYNNFKNVPREVSKIGYHESMREELEGMGYDSAFIDSFMAEVMEEDRFKVIQNIEEQSKVFADYTSGLVYEVLAKGGIVIIVSGNHYNKTTGGWQYDEATRLGSVFESYIKGRAGERAEKLISNMKIIPGSEYGGDVVSVDYKDAKDFMRIRAEHEGGRRISGLARTAERARDDSKTKLVVNGHIHQFSDVDTGSRFIVTAPAMQDSESNPYLNRINIPVDDGLKGGVYAELIVNGNEVKAVKTEPLLKAFMKDNFDLLRGKLDKKLMTANLGKSHNTD
ncbi:MAG: metallophosphoesterase [Candidatus Micrarchaeia archaeon]